jgi:hypothetical protein
MRTTLNGALNTLRYWIRPYLSARAQEEEEAWKRVSDHYDAYIKRQKEFLAKRIARMTPSSTHAAEDSQPTTPSAKANSEQRDTGMDDPWKSINIQDLPPDMKRGIAIAKALVASVQPKHSSTSGKSPPQKQQKRNSNTPLPMPTLPDGELDLIGQTLDEVIERRMHHVDFKLDYLLSCAHAARVMVKTAEELLNRWFEILEHNLSSRVNIQPGPPSTSSNPSDLGGFLAKYVPQRLPPAGFVIVRDPGSVTPTPTAAHFRNGSSRPVARDIDHRLLTQGKLRPEHYLHVSIYMIRTS